MAGTLFSSTNDPLLIHLLFPLTIFTLRNLYPPTTTQTPPPLPLFIKKYNLESFPNSILVISGTWTNSINIFINLVWIERLQEITIYKLVKLRLTVSCRFGSEPIFESHISFPASPLKWQLEFGYFSTFEVMQLTPDLTIQYI